MPDGSLRLDRRGNGIHWFWTKAKDNLIYHSHTDVPFTPPSDCCKRFSAVCATPLLGDRAGIFRDRH